MINRFRFTSFKSLRRVEACLQRFTVIVGPNGSGKTSILDGLDFLAQATTKPLGSFLVGDRDPLSLMTRDAPGPMELALEGRASGEEFALGISVERTEAAPGFRATVTGRWADVEQVRREGAPRSKLSAKLPVPQRPEDKIPKLAEELSATRKLRLDIEKLAAPSYSNEEVPALAMDGAGLASVLADLVGRSPETFLAITDAARGVVPVLERIRTRRAKVSQVERQEIVIDGEAVERKVERSYWGQQLLLDFKGARDVPAPLASEGTLVVLGLLTALYAEPRPRLVLLDDIDKALHPSAQEELVRQLRMILALDPALQIIATSHSPYLLDHFSPEEVLVTALYPDGSSACAPLSSHPDLERWRATTRTGELWSFVGEDWVKAQAGTQATDP